MKMSTTGNSLRQGGEQTTQHVLVNPQEGVPQGLVVIPREKLGIRGETLVTIGPSVTRHGYPPVAVKHPKEAGAIIFLKFKHRSVRILHCCRKRGKQWKE